MWCVERQQQRQAAAPVTLALAAALAAGVAESQLRDEQGAVAHAHRLARAVHPLEQDGGGVRGQAGAGQSVPPAASLSTV